DDRRPMLSMLAAGPPLSLPSTRPQLCGGPRGRRRRPGDRLSDTVRTRPIVMELADAMTGFRTLDQADVKGKRVLLRVDLNVPIQDGMVSDATRIERMAPTIVEIADRGGMVILLSHLGRPTGPEPQDSLQPI